MEDKKGLKTLSIFLFLSFPSPLQVAVFYEMKTNSIMEQTKKLRGGWWKKEFLYTKSRILITISKVHAKIIFLLHFPGVGRVRCILVLNRSFFFCVRADIYRTLSPFLGLYSFSFKIDDKLNMPTRPCWKTELLI